MTDQPCKPTRPTAIITPDSGVTVTWTPNAAPPPMYINCHANRCPDCGLTGSYFTLRRELRSWRPTANRCQPCAVYTALPWWRRAITRKPKP